MRTVATFATPQDADVAVSVLQAAGIKALVPNASTVQWLWSSATGGIRIDVPDESYDDAVELLKPGPLLDEPPA